MVLWVSEEVTLVLVETSEDLGHLGLTPVLGVGQVGQVGHVAAEQVLDAGIVDQVSGDTGTDFTEQVVVADWHLYLVRIRFHQKVYLGAGSLGVAIGLQAVEAAVGWAGLGGDGGLVDETWDTDAVLVGNTNEVALLDAEKLLEVLGLD